MQPVVAFWPHPEPALGAGVSNLRLADEASDVPGSEVKIEVRCNNLHTAILQVKLLQWHLYLDLYMFFWGYPISPQAGHVNTIRYIGTISSKLDQKYDLDIWYNCVPGRAGHDVGCQALGSWDNLPMHSESWTAVLIPKLQCWPNQVLMVIGYLKNKRCRQGEFNARKKDPESELACELLNDYVTGAPCTLMG